VAKSHRLAAEVRAATFAEIERVGLLELKAAEVVRQFLGRVPRSTAFRLVRGAIDLRSAARCTDLMTLSVRKRDELRALLPVVANNPLPSDSAALAGALKELSLAAEYVIREIDRVNQTSEVILAGILTMAPRLAARVFDGIIARSANGG
jgi:hypothetical protein